MFEATNLTAARTARPHPGESVHVRASATAVASTGFLHRVPARLDGVVVELTQGLALDTVALNGVASA